MLHAIKKIRIHEEVVSQIHELIKEGKFKAGDQLPSERELAETLRVSRTSVREALRALGIIAAFQDDHERIQALLEESLHAHRVAGAWHGAACTLAILGYTVGLYQRSQMGAGGRTVVSTGKYVSIWRRERGAWKVILDTGVPDPPK